MNTKNNRRRKESLRRMEEAFFQLLEEKALGDVTVSELCKRCGLNRSTFYANYTDIYDLADHVRARLEAEVDLLFQGEGEKEYISNDFLKLFRHIQENQMLYRTYFKLGYADLCQNVPYDTELALWYFDDRNIKYHIEFFRAGFNALVRQWLLDGCQETPEEMADILDSEYQGR